MNKFKQKPSAPVPSKKSTLRSVTRTKWELPIREARSYWDHIFDEMEAEQRKVNESMYSIFPKSSLNIPLDTSASNNVNTLSEFANLTDKKINCVHEPIVKISPPSPSHNDDDTSSTEKNSVRDSIESLKNHDSSNFNLDVKEDKESDKKDADIIIDNEKVVSQKDSLPVFSAISKITQLTKISRCVNDFLASTRIKVKATISPRNYVHPLRESIPEISHGGHCIIEKKFIAAENQTTVEESSIKADAGHVVNKWESLVSPPQKRVAFDENVDDVEKPSRPRAPSLGVASLVPSFGKIISSIEYSESMDSRSSIESPQDDLVQSRESVVIPHVKRSAEKTKHLLAASTVQYSSKSRYPRCREIRNTRGHQYWSRKTIVHTIRALKAMKAGTKIKERLQQEHNSFVSSPLPISSYSSIGRSLSSSIEQELFGENATSSSSSSPNHSPPMEVSKIHVDRLSGALKLPLMIRKTSVTIKDLPPIGGMYQRKRKNKCLACLYRWRPKSDSRFTILDETETSSYCKAAILDFNDFLTTKLTRKAKKVRVKDEPICNSDEVNASPVINLEDFKSSEVREGVSPMEKKFSQSILKDDLKSAKSFISTLSLSSDHSRTISDQEDSDHGPETMADAGEEVPGSGSKYRAPCHAPLNLKPSLEPLMALKDKKSKSIQSRVASLEKSIDEGSEGDTDTEDDDDLDQNIVLKVKEVGIQEAVPKPAEIRTPTVPELEKKEEVKNDGKFSKTDEYLQKRSLSMKKDRGFSEKPGAISSLSEEIYNQLNVKLRVTEHDPSVSFRPLSPVMSECEIIEITEKSLKEYKPIKDILQLLLCEYCNRLSDKLSNDRVLVDHNVQKIEKITKRLLALLVDSKLYLNPEFTTSNLQFSSKQKPYCNSQQLRRYLPFKSYNLVAPILGMPEWYPKRWSAIKSARSLKFSLKPEEVATVVTDSSSDSQVIREHENLSDVDLIVHPPSTRESLLDEVTAAKKSKKTNPYAMFLTKTRRKVVIWRPLIERDFEGYDPESTLKNRAARVTDRICKDFCDWLRSLGGSQDTIDEATLKDMFETDFSAEACRTLQVVIREMPVVPAVVAATRHCPESGEPEVTRRQLIRDVKAERQARTFVGFGTTVPEPLRYEPPNNDVYCKWIQCSSVPQDLETMSFVWQDITKLDSVKGFSEWLASQSNVKLPETLLYVRKKSFSKKH